jgi:hypothetical protein
VEVAGSRFVDCVAVRFYTKNGVTCDLMIGIDGVPPVKMIFLLFMLSLFCAGLPAVAFDAGPDVAQNPDELQLSGGIPYTPRPWALEAGLPSRAGTTQTP